MFNFKLPTPDELRYFQIEHYTALMKTAKSFKQKIFLRKQIYQLKNDSNSNNPCRHIHSTSSFDLVQNKCDGLCR